MEDLFKEIVRIREYVQEKDLQKAFSLLYPLHQKYPKDPQILCLLASILVQNQQEDQAIQCFQRALEFSAEDPQTLCEAGVFFLKEELFEKSRECFERLLSSVDKLDHSYIVEGCGNLAIVYDHLREDEKALFYYQKAVENSQKPEFLSNLASFYFVRGMKEKAFEVWKKVLIRWPHNPNALYGCMMVDPTSYFADTVRQLCEQKLVHPMILHARASISRECPSEWFSWIERSCTQVRSEISYSLHEETEVFRKISKVFHRNWSAPETSSDDQDPFIIFIVGMPRSGTSLLHQLLSCHSAVDGLGELTFLRRAIKGFFTRKKSSFPQCFERVEPEDFLWIKEEYLKRLRVLSTSSFVIDKMPMNFLFTPLIPRIFPRSLTIHIKRNPADTCFSCYSQFFTSYNPWSWTQEETAGFYRLYQQLMIDFLPLCDHRFMEVGYEELIKDPKNILTAILGRIHLNWEEEILNFHTRKNPLRTASATQVRQGIHDSSVDRYKQFEEFLHPMLKILNEAAQQNSR